MEITASDLEKAALLHDIGKAYQRAEKKRKSHSAIGEEVLRKFFKGEKENILRAVALHHRKELEEEEPASDDMSYIIYEADNLAAAVDRRDEAEENGDSRLFDAQLPLENIFNQFQTEKEKSGTAYPVRLLNGENDFTFPKALGSVIAPDTSYQKITEQLDEIFAHHSLAEMPVNELLQILGAAMSFIPSSTNKQEIPDISLYDHQKITAAFAVCMWQYFQEKKITDYKAWCYGSKNKTLREKNCYRLVSGDMSGIQKFIYTIPSKGALKSLRGRSLYLDVLLEHIADEILEACGVSRSCLLYTGGGHFYMLLPNTDRVKTILDSFQIKLQDWFLRYYGNRLYMALASVSCCASDFMKNGQGAGLIFRLVSRKLGKAKLNRYTETQLENMFDPQSAYNQLKDTERECAICHTSTADLQPYGEETDGDEACAVCNGLYYLGQQALDHAYLAVTDTPQEHSVPLPGMLQDLYLTAVRENDMDKIPGCRRLYAINTLQRPDAIALWMGNYTARNANGSPKEFADLARESGGGRDETGIERIGILRADVDNLGAAFIAGIPRKNDTLSRKAVLSRSLAFFFKQYINQLCQGKLPEGETSFTLFTGEKKKARNLHIIYSGGDDLFLAGSWDDIIETAVDLRHAFARFTNGKLTLSAGIGLFHPSYPIAQMARQTGELEDYAKGNPGKNSVALFGKVAAYEDGEEISLTPCYTWDEFENGVCREKLHFLEENFALDSTESAYKLPMGKSLLYRLLGLLRDADQEKINVARFAYVLARMEPKRGNPSLQACYKNVRSQLYAWYRDETDRQQLITAIELLVYFWRDKNDEREAQK